MFCHFGLLSIVADLHNFSKLTFSLQHSVQIPKIHAIALWTVELVSRPYTRISIKRKIRTNKLQQFIAFDRRSNSSLILCVYLYQCVSVAPWIFNSKAHLINVYFIDKQKHKKIVSKFYVNVATGVITKKKEVHKSHLLFVHGL